MKSFKDNESGSDAEDDIDQNDDCDKYDFYENIEIDEEDERALEMFMSRNPEKTRTLADIIMDKITEKQTELRSQFSDAGDMQMQEIDPRSVSRNSFNVQLSMQVFHPFFITSEYEDYTKASVTS